MGLQAFENILFHPLEGIPEEKWPKQFTFPFYYEPHPLCVQASQQLWYYLEHQNSFDHNFGLNPNQSGLIIGKMFGVMVVKNTKAELGFLAAFSGKMAESNHLNGFVPPIFNNLEIEGFYKQGEAKLNQYNRDIEILEHSEILKEAERNLKISEQLCEKEIQSLKMLIKEEKEKRDLKRKEAKPILTAKDFKKLDEVLSAESKNYQIQLKRLKRDCQNKKIKAQAEFVKAQLPLETLKAERAKLSAKLQKQLHESYVFFNAKGKTRDLLAVFRDTVLSVPPAGSGECAAPKLFQYAYKNNLKPIAMAEFWWGASPKSEVRKHKQFYPSCRSKCEPILGFMMQGLDVEENPIEKTLAYSGKLEIVYEDDYLLLVNKPPEFLSVPGKTQAESVLIRMKHYLPHAKGPLLVHRLDMSTSGLLLVAKTERIHKQLQKQFVSRTVKKRYVALLDGILNKKVGQIILPLRVDLDNRPQQLVCYDHGKSAITNYEVVAVENGKTRIYFYPVTGRTHQLRIHAAHVNGLDTPIVGDDLYGKRADRLHLHAESITFVHPATKTELTINCKVPF
ncbi:MAG: pseudouridine synthase [Aestuariibaculum sp.]